MTSESEAIAAAGWDGCTKPGPCPCADPCEWAARVTEQAERVAALQTAATDLAPGAAELNILLADCADLLEVLDSEDATESSFADACSHTIELHRALDSIEARLAGRGPCETAPGAAAAWRVAKMAAKKLQNDLVEAISEWKPETLAGLQWQARLALSCYRNDFPATDNEPADALYERTMRQLAEWDTASLAA